VLETDRTVTEILLLLLLLLRLDRSVVDNPYKALCLSHTGRDKEFCTVWNSAR
jgi:hypothetical protein